MTPDQMRERSASKVKQITDMMKILNVRVEARERMDKEGFIDKMVFWIDEEPYKSPDSMATGPTGEPKENHD